MVVWVTEKLSTQKIKTQLQLVSMKVKARCKRRTKYRKFS